MPRIGLDRDHAGAIGGARPKALIEPVRDKPRVDAGSTRVVRWQVNGTRKLARQVQIALSTDNGRTWEHVLVDRTANDGEATVTFPDIRSRRTWLRISAVDNYFFDVNDSPFRIG